MTSSSRSLVAPTSTSTVGLKNVVTAKGVFSPGSISADPAIDIRPVEAAVNSRHLAVEVGQRSQPDVTVLGQLGELVTSPS